MACDSLTQVQLWQIYVLPLALGAKLYSHYKEYHCIWQRFQVSSTIYLLVSKSYDYSTQLSVS